MGFIKLLKNIVKLLCILVITGLINYKSVFDSYNNFITEKYIKTKEKIPNYIDINNYKLLIKSGGEKEVLDKNYVYIMKNSSFNNIFLAGHNNLVVFNRIYKLRKNDLIKLNYNNVLYNYEVYSMSYINVKDLDIFKEDSFNKLTLITCTNNNQKRYIVKCKIKE